MEYHAKIRYCIYYLQNIKWHRKLCLVLSGRHNSTKCGKLFTLYILTCPDHPTFRNFTEVSAPWIFLRFLFHPWLKGFPDSSVGKESARNVGDLGSIPGLGRSAGEGKGYPLQYSGLENSMDCIVYGVANNQTWLSDFHFTMTCIYFLPRYLE